MNKRIKILIILIIILLIPITLFIIESFDRTKPSTEFPIETIPHITSNERINRIIFNSHQGNVLRERYGQSILNENSLINLIHIIKEESSYKISCEFGPAYENANLNKFYPEEIISMGQIKNCTVEVAEIIDEIIKSSETDCRFPLVTPGRLPMISNLTDYYIVTLKVEEHEITQEWVDRRYKEKCFESLENLIGEKIAIQFLTGVADLKNNWIFY